MLASLLPNWAVTRFHKRCKCLRRLSYHTRDSWLQKIILKISLVKFTLWTLNLNLLLCYAFHWSFNVFTLTGSSNLEVSRERSKYEILAITFCSWEEMHFVQYWGIHQKEIDTPCSIYVVQSKTLLGPFSWILGQYLKPLNGQIIKEYGLTSNLY